MSTAVAEASWQLRAACRGGNAEAFFPPPQSESRQAKAHRESRAKLICEGCDVRPECLSYALSISERHGIWGGTSEGERRAMLRSAAAS